jgi:hypothetical protein
MSDIEALREEFEAWHRREYPSILVRQHRVLGTYSDYGVECAWEGWLAGRRSSPSRERVIEECALVCERLNRKLDNNDSWVSNCAAALRARKALVS